MYHQRDLRRTLGNRYVMYTRLSLQWSSHDCGLQFKQRCTKVSGGICPCVRVCVCVLSYTQGLSKQGAPAGVGHAGGTSTPLFLYCLSAFLSWCLPCFHLQKGSAPRQLVGFVFLCLIMICCPRPVFGREYPRPGSNS